MCGIVGYAGSQNAAEILLDGLKKLEYRGYDSAGIAVMNNKHISVNKVTGRIENLCEITENGRSVIGKIGIGHTRWATHGSPTDINAHPHMSNSGKFAVVHNGIIENYIALKQELINKGFNFESETDTEVIAHLLEMYYTDDIKKAFYKAVSRLEGSYAIGVISTDEPDKIFLARQSSPLILGVGMGENYFASDVTALVAYTKNIIYMDDGEFAELTPDYIKVFDWAGHPVEKPINRITWDIQAAEKGGYDHFMLKEIIEQPAAVRAAICPRIKNEKICFDDSDIDKSIFTGVEKIIITACGSAYYAGCCGKYIIEKLCGIPVETELASELRYRNPIIDENTLLIVLSQSGETADTIAAMRECKNRGAKTLAIVNVVGSTIAKAADYTIYTLAGPEIAVATTKGYTTQLAVLYLFSVYFAKEKMLLNDEEYHRLLTELKDLPKYVEEAIDMNFNISELAKKYCNTNSIFFIGRNTDYAVALEGALKMKEISYIHAEAYAAGELKHGTIALIDENQPVVALCCNEQIIEKTVSNIVEVKARSACVIGVSFKNNEKILTVADDIIFVPRVDGLFAPIVEVVPLQLIAYYIAKEKGCDIDMPKNLAKSVTVE